MSNVKHNPIHESSSHHPSTGTTSSGTSVPGVTGDNASRNNKNADTNARGGPVFVPPDDRFDADQSIPLGGDGGDDDEPHLPEGGDLPDGPTNLSPSQKKKLLEEIQQEEAEEGAEEDTEGE